MSRCAIRELFKHSLSLELQAYSKLVLMTVITLKNLLTVAFDSGRLMNAKDFGKQCIIIVFDFCNMTLEAKHRG